MKNGENSHAEIALYEPEFSELWFRQELLADPETMAYNHAWGGTVCFPPERWEKWYCRWLGGDARYFYRYLKNAEGKFVGEAAYHFEDSRFLCDVIILAQERGKGYGRNGLELLCRAAKERGLTEVYDRIAIDNPAIRLFLNSGFEEVSRDSEGILVSRML